MVVGLTIRGYECKNCNRKPRSDDGVWTDGNSGMKHNVYTCVEQTREVDFQQM